MLDKWLRELQADPSNNEAVAKVASELIRLDRIGEVGDYLTADDLIRTGFISDNIFYCCIGARVNEAIHIQYYLDSLKETIIERGFQLPEIILTITVLMDQYPALLRLLEIDDFIDHPLSQSLLRGAIRNRFQAVRSQAIRAAYEANFQDIDFFIEALNDEGWENVNYAALNDEGWENVNYAARSISGLGSSEKAMHALISTFPRMPSVHILLALHHGKGQWDISPAIRFLEKISLDKEQTSENRSGALDTLGYLSDGQHDALFLQIIEDPNEGREVKRTSAQSMKSAHSIGRIVKLLKDGNVRVSIRNAFVISFANMGSRKTFPFLLMAEQSFDPHLATIAHEGMSRLGIHSIEDRIQCLLECREDPDPVIRETALRVDVEGEND